MLHRVSYRGKGDIPLGSNPPPKIALTMVARVLQKLKGHIQCADNINILAVPGLSWCHVSLDSVTRGRGQVTVVRF